MFHISVRLIPKLASVALGKGGGSNKGVKMKVLVIEDDPEIIDIVSMCFELRWPNTKIIHATEGGLGLAILEKERPDVVILDIGLPDMDGYEVCKGIRRISEVPLIMLTVNAEDIDIAKGLDLGADDYMVKPFNHRVLLARVQAVLRRCQKPFRHKQQELQVGKVKVDSKLRQVWVDGKQIKLNYMEFDLLYNLLSNAGKVMPTEHLLKTIWGIDHLNARESLKVFIENLRRRLGDDPQDPRLIISEPGVGYRFRHHN